MALLDLFGFKVKDKTGGKQIPSVISPSSTDGSIIVDSAVVSGGWQGYAYDLDSAVKTENDQIRRYREVAQMPEVDSAVADIVNEAVVSDQDDYPVKLELDNLKVSDPIKKKFQDSFIEILNILEFNERGHDIFRQWYVDGKLYFHILFKDNDIKNGIAEVRQIDPMKIRKVKNINKIKNDKGIDIVDTIEEYYVYNDRGIVENSVQGIKLSPDSVVMVTSGMMDVANMSTIGYLQKTIKPANQLRMLEDAIVIYTITRAPDRRIFYIDVGSLPKMKAEQYVTDIMNKFKNKLVYNASTGELADSKKHMCLSMDTKVPLLDGRTLSISEISEEMKQSDKPLWAYSCDPVTGKFIPGKITWAGVSRPNAQVVRLTLDNGATIVCTPDHKFPVWNKGFVKAEDLSIGSSMIPRYTRLNGIARGIGKEYEQIFNNESGTWTYTHRLVSDWKDSVKLENEFVFNEEYRSKGLYTVHHQNINRFDNSPENLVRMNSKDHILWHRDSASKSGVVGGTNCYLMGKGFHNKNHPHYLEWRSKAGTFGGAISASTGKCQENWAIGRETLSKNFSDDDWKNWFVAQQIAGWTDELRDAAGIRAKKRNLSTQGNRYKIEQFKNKNSEISKKHKLKYATEYPSIIVDAMIETIRTNNKLTKLQLLEILNKNANLTDLFVDANKFKVKSKNKDYSKFNISDIDRMAVFANYNSYQHARDSLAFRNHKIVNIEILDERIDTGCLTIDGNEIYHNHHTFALDAGIYTQNSMIEDFWLARRDGSKGTEISSLPGSQSLIQADFVEYFQNKLFQSLNVPISRMKPETGFTLGKSQEITREELKFSKFVGKLRIKFSSLFHSLLRIQLIAKGIIRADEWDNIRSKIRYDFIRDNHFSELKEAEILTNRLATLQLVDPYLGKYYSKRYIQKNVLNMDDEDISDIESEIKKEGEDAVPSEITNQRAIMQMQQDMAGQQPEQEEQQ